VGPGTIEAIDWGVTLQVVEALPEALTDVGIRAHQVRITPSLNQELKNTFPCWVASTSETPHRMTVFLKLNTVPQHSQDYHVQAEMFKEKWELIKEYPFPWYVTLDPLRLILMTG
jgi:molybdate transport system permease protein